jgi:uncharacterized protein
LYFRNSMILHIIVKPQRKFDRIEKKGNEWQVSIRAKPMDNEANEYLVRYLSSVLKLPTSAIRISRGHRSKTKQIEISADEQSILEKLKVCSGR